MSDRFHRLKNRFKSWWDRQPEIIVYQPIKINTNPQPTPFQVSIEGRKIKGFVLRKDESPRLMSPRGNSFQISVPKTWVEHLKRNLKPLLVQIHDEIGIFFMPENLEGGENT